MKYSIIIVCFLFFITACNDSKKNYSDNPAKSNDSIEFLEEEDKATENPDKQLNDSVNRANEEKPIASTFTSGVYINSEHTEDNNCNCYCIDIKLNSTSKLCLTEEDLYIMGRFEKQDDKINIYYAGKSSENSNDEIPWEEFETGTPIAVLTPSNNGFELDWKGFYINGEIAIDYALLGKKSLEGTYKKK